VTEQLTDLVNAIQPTVQASAQSGQIVLWGAGGLAGLALVQVVFFLWTTWRLRELGQLRERLSRLADGLALLTDTTEAGLGTIARQIEQLARRPAAAAKTATRMTVAKRVVQAALKGDKVSHIARNEALSESEVRLHLALADSAKVKGQRSEAKGQKPQVSNPTSGLKPLASKPLASKPLASKPLAITLEETACLAANTSR
jgi:hypothetical protein